MSRIALAVGLLLAGAFGAQALAGSHMEESRVRWRLEDRVGLLELEVADLRASKIEMMAAFQASLIDRADRLERVAKDARAQGFTAHANSTRSRITLLDGVEAFAKALRTTLPELSDEAKARQTALTYAMRSARGRIVRTPKPVQPGPGAGTMPRDSKSGEEVDRGTPSEDGDEDETDG